MEIGIVQSVDIEQEMRTAYLDYAMSVIVARALPDARDGLKPVQRRILYAMHDLGLRPDAPYKKSARIVGEVLGKYHPHGDMAVYEAMARMVLYFGGMYRHFAVLFPRLRPGACCAYVVGDQMSFFRVHIRTAHLLADVAIRAGYEVDGIELWRTRRSTVTGMDLEMSCSSTVLKFQEVKMPERDEEQKLSCRMGSLKPITRCFMQPKQHC